MYFYKLSLNDVKELTVATFWELYKNIVRIKANEELRLLRMYSALLDEKIVDDLKKEIGNVIEYSEVINIKNELNKLRDVLK